MSDLYNKASLVMTPQLVDTGKVYSIKPEDRKGDFTFTRSSAATRVGADGNIEKETQNLLLKSNSFNTTWNVDTNVVLTSGQSGYDGTNDAWKFDKDANQFRAIRQTPTYSGVVTFSIYVKEGTLRYLNFYHPSTTARIWFDLQAGAVGFQGGAYIENKIEDVGSGWYRCSVTYNASSGGELRIYPSSADGAYTAVAGSIYIQDAQLEQGLVARDYIETTTTALYGGITDNVPRLDYTDSSCPALLLEPLRTNLLYHSEYFSSGSGGWQPYGGAVLTYNNAISLEGITNAMKMTSGGVFATFPTAANTDYVFSVFAKTDTATSIALNYTDQSGPFRGGGITYTFATNSVAVTSQSENNSVSADREDYGNGWIRVMIKFKTNVAKSYNYQEISFAGGDGWIYGAQYEAGSYATSYIPTYGSSVTRVGETCQVEDKGALINSEQGTLYFEGIAIDPSFANVISFSDGTNTNRICLTLPQNATNINAFSSVGGSKIDNNILHDPSVNSKYAIVWNGNSFKVFVNGVKKVDNTMAGSFSANTLTDIRFDRGDGNLNFGGFCKSYLSIASALTDQQAIDLTTI